MPVYVVYGQILLTYVRMQNLPKTANSCDWPSLRAMYVAMLCT